MSVKDKDKLGREIAQARDFSEHFEVDVFMLPESIKGGNIYIEKQSNPDSIVLGMFLDFKHNESNTESSIQYLVRKGVGQADAVYLSLGKESSLKDVKSWIYGQAKGKSKYMDFPIIISDYDGNFYEYEIKEKGLVESPFISRAKLSPSSGSNLTQPSDVVKTRTPNLFLMTH